MFSVKVEIFGSVRVFRPQWNIRVGRKKGRFEIALALERKIVIFADLL